MKKLITSAARVENRQGYQVYHYDKGVDIRTGLVYDWVLDEIASDIIDQFYMIARNKNRDIVDVKLSQVIAPSAPNKDSYYLDYTFVFRTSSGLKVPTDVEIYVDSETQTCTINNPFYRGFDLYEAIYPDSKSANRDSIAGDEEGAVPKSVVKSSASKIVSSINRRLKQRGFSPSGLKASNFILDYFDPYNYADYMCDLTNSKGVSVPLVLKFEYNDGWDFLGTAEDLSRQEYEEYLFYDYCNEAGLDVELPEWYLAMI